MFMLHLLFVVVISTHSLTRRLTDLTRACFQEFPDFNSQPHKEADHTCYHETYRSHYISTHSLTRRLTVDDSAVDMYKIISTHSLTRRLTGHHHTEIVHDVEFQLTASQGG